MQTITARQLNNDLAAAKRASEGGPVVVTNRGRKSHVLMTWEEYERLAKKRKRGSIADRLHHKGWEHVDLPEPPPELPPRPIEL